MGLVGALLASSVACDSASKRLDKADELHAAGDHDAALAALESVLADYPDSPEAADVPRRMNEVLASRVSATLDAGDLDGALSQGVVLQSRPGGEAALASHVAGWAEIEPFVQAMSAGPDRQALQLAKPARHAIQSDGGRQAMDTWLCAEAKSFPQWAECSEPSTDLDKWVHELVAQLAVARAACEDLHTIAAACPDHHPAIVAMIDAPDLAALAAKIPEADAEWRADELKSMNDRLASVQELAASCQKTKRDTLRLLQQMTGSETQAMLFWMLSKKGGKFDDGSPMSSQLISYKIGWMKSLLLISGSLIDKEYHSEACNDSVDESLVKVLKDCTESGAVEDTRWITKIDLSACPGTSADATLPAAPPPPTGNPAPAADPAPAAAPSPTGEGLDAVLSASFDGWPVPDAATLTGEGVQGYNAMRIYTLPAGTEMAAIEPLVAAIEADGFERAADTKLPQAGQWNLTLTKGVEMASVTLSAIPSAPVPGSLTMTRGGIDPATRKPLVSAPTADDIPAEVRAFAPASPTGVVGVLRGEKTRLGAWTVSSDPAKAVAEVRPRMEEAGYTVTMDQTTAGLVQVVASKGTEVLSVMAMPDPVNGGTSLTVTMNRP